MNALSLVSLDQYCDKQKRAAARVLDSLDQLDARLASHYASKRRHNRIPYRGEAILCFPSPDQPILNPNSEDACRVHVRSLSQSGLAFIYPGVIAQSTMLIGLHLPNSETTWFSAEVVRQREIEQEEFWEYGVKFLQRAAV